MHKAKRFVVSGLVQGVYFRASTRNQAWQLGLTGYARNMEDGGVEVLAVGEASAMDAMERWLWQGSPASQVTHVQVSEVTDLNEKPAGFLAC